MQERDYDDVPGTYVLDSRTYRRGYHLNMFLMTLNKAECRAEFAADEAAYLDMLKLGANVYYTFKLVSHDRQPPQVMYGKMARPEMSFEEFQQMMISGGRSIDGNRSKKEQPDG